MDGAGKREAVRPGDADTSAPAVGHGRAPVETSQSAATHHAIANWRGRPLSGASAGHVGPSAQIYPQVCREPTEAPDTVAVEDGLGPRSRQPDKPDRQRTNGQVQNSLAQCLECPSCGAVYGAVDARTIGGRKVRCWACDHVWRVPTATGASDADLKGRGAEQIDPWQNVHVSNAALPRPRSPDRATDGRRVGDRSRAAAWPGLLKGGLKSRPTNRRGLAMFGGLALLAAVAAAAHLAAPPFWRSPAAPVEITDVSVSFDAQATELATVVSATVISRSDTVIHPFRLRYVVKAHDGTALHIGAFAPEWSLAPGQSRPVLLRFSIPAEDLADLVETYPDNPQGGLRVELFDDGRAALDN